jgi:hypothetical protein
MVAKGTLTENNKPSLLVSPLNVKKANKYLSKSGDSLIKITPFT